MVYIPERFDAGRNFGKSAFSSRPEVNTVFPLPKSNASLAAPWNTARCVGGAMTQLTFPVKAQSQLEEKFLEFHAKHPEVYAALSRFAHQWRDRKGPDARLGIKMVIERVRWELALGARDETPRLNNNHSAFYARLLMAQEPALEGMFFLKKQRYESTIGADDA